MSLLISFTALIVGYFLRAARLWTFNPSQGADWNGSVFVSVPVPPTIFRKPVCWSFCSVHETFGLLCKGVQACYSEGGHEVWCIMHTISPITHQQNVSSTIRRHHRDEDVRVSASLLKKGFLFQGCSQESVHGLWHEQRKFIKWSVPASCSQSWSKGLALRLTVRGHAAG